MTGNLEEKNENKYLVLDDVDESKDVPKKFGKVLKKIETINGGKKIDYGKDF